MNYQFRSTGFTGKRTQCVSEQRKLSDRNLQCAKVIIRQLADVFVIYLLFPDAHVKDLVKRGIVVCFKIHMQTGGIILLELGNQVRHIQLLQ
jgi:hypothetical protein